MSGDGPWRTNRDAWGDGDESVLRVKARRGKTDVGGNGNRAVFGRSSKSECGGGCG